MEPVQGQTIIPGAEAPVQMSFLNIIHITLDALSTLKENKKMEMEKLESELLQSTAYAEADEKAKAAVKLKKEAKARLLETPIVAEIAEKINNLNEDIKLEKATLAHGAFNYQKQTGEESIVRNGSRYQIVKSVKLRKIKEKRK